jgi:hypothetical protein
MARLKELVRRGFGYAFIVIWSAVGAQLLATHQHSNVVFWIIYVAVWVWYVVLVVLRDRRRDPTKG